MRKKSKEAQRPGDYPYRLYNATYQGKWTKNGITGSYGTFSIKNYTDQTIFIEALSIESSGKYLYGGYLRQFGDDRVSFSVSPNSTKEKVYIRANPKGRLIVDSNVGVRRESGWKGK